MSVEPGSISANGAERPLVIARSSSIRAALHDRHRRTVRGCTVRVPYVWNVGADGSDARDLPVLVDDNESIGRLIGAAPPAQTVRRDPARSTRDRAARERWNDLYEVFLGRHPLGMVWSYAGAPACHATQPLTELANTIES